MKAFKYFDLNNNGTVEPDEFAKAIEKIGIMIPTRQVSLLKFHSHLLSSLSFLRFNREREKWRLLFLFEFFSSLFNFILQDLDALFRIYDTDGSGAIDYKEFSDGLFNKGGSGGSPSKAGGGGGGSGPEQLVEKLRTKLASRGARGIIGLGK